MDLYDIKDKLLTSGFGISGIELAEIIIPSPEFIDSFGKLLIQLAIGVVTIIRIFRDNKNK